MASSYKLAAYSGIMLLILAFFVAGFALLKEGNYVDKSQYLIYLMIVLISVGLYILYYRGFIEMSKAQEDKRLLAFVLAVFLFTILAVVMQFVYSSILFFDTARFNINEALLHQNSLHGRLLFNLHIGIIALLFGYGLIRSNIPLRIVKFTGIMLIVSGIMALFGVITQLISDVVGATLYIIAGIMLIILLFEFDKLKVKDNKQTTLNDRIEKPKDIMKNGKVKSKVKKANNISKVKKVKAKKSK